MNTIINDIVSYVDAGKKTEEIDNLENIVGKRELRVVSIKLLSWLKYQHRSNNKRSLQLNEKFAWCCNLIRCLQHADKLSLLFCVENNKFDFCDRVIEEERDTIRLLVFNEYNPPLMK